MLEVAVRRFRALHQIRPQYRAALLATMMAVLLAATGVEAAQVGSTWTPAGSMSTARIVHTATLLSNDKVLVAGGADDRSYLSSADLYDARTGRWTATGSMNSPHGFHTATLLANGSVLVAGGSGNVATSAVAELYDPRAGSWSTTDSLNDARRWHTATLLPNGKVLVAGGVFTQSKINTVLSSAELYDPGTGTWSATGSLNTPRVWHTATLLPNGKVLVAGGKNDYSAGTSLPSAELYDPSTGTWTTTDAMSTARFSHTATRLADGRVLVAGGRPGDTSASSSAELYDAGTGSWSTTGSMSAPRYSQAAVLVSDGEALVVGGFGEGNAVLSSAELYDPKSGAWISAGDMSSPRHSHTATSLPGGGVLVAGGAGSFNVALGPVFASAELFHAGANDNSAKPQKVEKKQKPQKPDKGQDSTR